MARFDTDPAADALHPALLANVILHAPAWARVGITAPTERMRVQAANELAEVIARHITGGAPSADMDQLSLRL